MTELKRIKDSIRKIKLKIIKLNQEERCVEIGSYCNYHNKLANYYRLLYILKNKESKILIDHLKYCYDYEL